VCLTRVDSATTAKVIHVPAGHPAASMGHCPSGNSTLVLLTMVAADVRFL